MLLRIACCGQIELADPEGAPWDGVRASGNNRSEAGDCKAEATAWTGASNAGEQAPEQPWAAGVGLAQLVGDIVRSMGVSDCEVHDFANPIDLIESAASTKAEHVVDLVICASEVPGMAGVRLVRDLRNDGYDGRIVLCARDMSVAPEAFALRVDGLVEEPADASRFRRVVEAAARTAAGDRATSFELRARDGLRPVRFAQVIYAKTADHDQELYLSGGDVVTARLSSQALFELLEPSGKFFKAGSSYIVNLSAVRLIDAKTSTARLEGGVVIPIPGRVRKGLEAAVLA